MEIIEIQTLIDITNTRVTRLSQGTQQALDQNRNFITINQCIELRSVVHYENQPTVEEMDIKGMGFGTEYKGKNTVWTFTFSPDRDGVYQDNDGNDLGFLLEDIHEVPVIKNLTETINIGKAIFDLKDTKNKNTIIKALKGTT